jgi:hypothetical protein
MGMVTTTESRLIVWRLFVCENSSEKICLLLGAARVVRRISEREGKFMRNAAADASQPTFCVRISWQKPLKTPPEKPILSGESDVNLRS